MGQGAGEDSLDNCVQAATADFNPSYSDLANCDGFSHLLCEALVHQEII
jgi:hypothetical protein